MTKYNTGNPVGSSDPRDLFDNAKNADYLENGQASEYRDRLGKLRKSRAGMEKAFNEFLVASGYQFLGDYAEGIEVTAHNQIVRHAGEFWRLAGGTDLPYTTTGAGMPEGGAFVAVGDANLRQELSDSATGNGSDRVTITGTGESLTSAVSHVRRLKTLADVADGNYGNISSIIVSGDASQNENQIELGRRSGFDDPNKAGSPAEILGSTLFAWDSNGAAFTEIKSALMKRDRSEGKLSGRHVHIYRWGTPFSGNDWCFIRTPDNYDPSGKPHPFVILNHGNGWFMDGTEQYANFSSKTQFGVDDQNGGTYLDTSRSDYVEYSSPLIEAFLAEGYVVCGAQNAGSSTSIDAGYGNRETQQNIMFFYQHMVENFNVKDYCHMIGASNGCIATLNATRILGNERVRSITLLYPLINLYAAWSGNYQQPVSEAYNFDADPDNFAAFASSTRGYDPLVAGTDFSMYPADSRWTESDYANTNFVRLYDDAGSPKWLRENRLVDPNKATDLSVPLDDMTFYRRSIFPWPRIRAHYSEGDTVTPPQQHWLAFEKLLNRGGHVNFGLEVTGGHGDYTHFEGTDGNGIASIVGWTKL